MSKALFEFHAACREVVVCRGNPALNYAVGYANAGLSMTDPEECLVQCLYIRNNISGWRGPIAKATRETFRRLSLPSAWKELV